MTTIHTQIIRIINTALLFRMVYYLYSRDIISKKLLDSKPKNGKKDCRKKQLKKLCLCSILSLTAFALYVGWELGERRSYGRESSIKTGPRLKINRG